MCLAKAYMRPVGAAENGSSDGDDLLMENVVHVEIDGDQLLLRSLFGNTESLRGHIASIDFSEGKLILHALEPAQATEVQHG